MHKRPMWMRLAAPAIVLALASPVWATEIQMKEKKDPKAEEQKQDSAEKDVKKKKNCPMDVMSFNTLEDMYGFTGTVDSLTLLQTQQTKQAKAPVTAEGTPVAPEVLWRAVEEPEKKDEKAPEKKAE